MVTTNTALGIDQWEFFTIRNVVIKANSRMKNKQKQKELTEAWLKLERAWYAGRGLDNLNLKSIYDE